MLECLHILPTEQCVLLATTNRVPSVVGHGQKRTKSSRAVTYCSSGKNRLLVACNHRITCLRRMDYYLKSCNDDRNSRQFMKTIHRNFVSSISRKLVVLKNYPTIQHGESFGNPLILCVQQERRFCSFIARYFSVKFTDFALWISWEDFWIQVLGLYTQ